MYNYFDRSLGGFGIKMINKILRRIITVLMYFLGCLFIFMGSITLKYGFLTYSLQILVGIILLPVVSHAFANKLNWSFKRENITKVIIAFILLLVSVIVLPESNTNDSTNKDNDNKTQEVTCRSFNSIKKDDSLSVEELSCYDFGKVLKPVLDELQIDDITEITIDDIEHDDYIWMTFITNTTELSCDMNLSMSDEWYVTKIHEKNDTSVNYYIYDNYIDTDKTILKDDIYSYKTKEIVQKRDVNQIGEYYRQQEEKRNQEKQAKINEIIQESQESIKMIYSDYQNNELSAKEKHKGKTYTFAGKFNGASDSGILNKLANEVDVDIIVTDSSGQEYLLHCGFDSDKWKDKLMEYNKGDDIYITGECYNWGNYNECTILTIY